MKGSLKIMKGDLPNYCVQHILDLSCQQKAPVGRVIGALQQHPKGQHFCEDDAVSASVKGVSDIK